MKYLLGSDAQRSMGDSTNYVRRNTTFVKCTREDMMKLIWLRAAPEDIDVMNQMFDLHRTLGARVKTPPLLPKKKRKQLLENFHFLDKRHCGHITYQDLVDGGLIDEQMMKDLKSKYDSTGKGIINQDDFLEMLCPHGCRAHEGVREMVSKDDKHIRLVYIDCRHLECGHDEFSGWLLDADFQELSTNSNLPFRFTPLVKPLVE